MLWNDSPCCQDDSYLDRVITQGVEATKAMWILNTEGLGTQTVKERQAKQSALIEPNQGV